MDLSLPAGKWWVRTEFDEGPRPAVSITDRSNGRSLGIAENGDLDFEIVEERPTDARTRVHVRAQGRVHLFRVVVERRG